MYYGECNQICGQNHSRMPIAVKAVTDAEFKTWVTQAKKAASVGPVTQSVLAEVEQTEAKGIKR